MPTEFTPLPRSFFEPSASEVAPQLLGHWLVHREGGDAIGGIIVEVEAYLREDPACHCFRGRTERNKAMWGPPGHAYVYLIYGCHFCVNTVCRPAGDAEGVLIRAIQPLWGLERMRARRRNVVDRHLASGPGKLTTAMGIDRTLDGFDLCNGDGALVAAKNPDRAATLRELGPVVQTTRIGISQAADWPMRWYLGGSHHISRK